MGADYKKRREFILSLIAATASFLFLGKFLKPKKAFEKNQNKIDIELSKISEKTATIFKNEKVALIKTDGKIVALSIICTHLGCTLNIIEDQFVCPCHGSIFDLHGDVVKSPAAKPLAKLKTAIKNDKLEVYL